MQSRKDLRKRNNRNNIILIIGGIIIVLAIIFGVVIHNNRGQAKHVKENSLQLILIQTLLFTAWRLET